MLTISILKVSKELKKEIELNFIIVIVYEFGNNGQNINLECVLLKKFK